MEINKRRRCYITKNAMFYFKYLIFTYVFLFNSTGLFKYILLIYSYIAYKIGTAMEARWHYFKKECACPIYCFICGLLLLLNIVINIIKVTCDSTAWSSSWYGNKRKCDTGDVNARERQKPHTCGCIIYVLVEYPMRITCLLLRNMLNKSMMFEPKMVTCW